MAKTFDRYKYTPREPTSFWCHACDQGPVSSTDPDTGDFFVLFGHAYDSATRLYDGDYTGVMFAFCKACQV